MKTITILILTAGFSTWGQSVKEMHPTLGYSVEKSIAGENEFKKNMENCNRVWGIPKDQLSEGDKKVLEKCNNEIDGVEGYYDILGPGCSWYCGGGIDTQTSSSALTSQGQNNYSADNAHDLSYKTAWIEGVSGYGIGEYLVYHFPPENPRITKIIIVNGYVKTPKTWQENSRVKRLKLYLDNNPIAILNLKDTKNEQIFSFAPLGHSDRDNFDKLKSQPSWSLKFEILEVYEGDKYDDTAITEIYFDGIDVH